MVVPELHNCVMKLDYMAGTPDSDGDYRYEYGLYTSSGVQLVSQYEVGYSDDDTAPDPSAYRWTLNVKYEAASIDGHIWRTGEGLFFRERKRGFILGWGRPDARSHAKNGYAGYHMRYALKILSA